MVAMHQSYFRVEIIYKVCVINLSTYIVEEACCDGLSLFNFVEVALDFWDFHLQNVSELLKCLTITGWSFLTESLKCIDE